MSAEEEMRAEEEMILAEETRGWRSSFIFKLVEFVSRSAGSGKKRRREREVVLVKGENGETYFSQTKNGLQPVRKRRGRVIIDDLMNETGTNSPDDALDKLRQVRRG